MSKKIIAVLLAVLMLLTFATGCKKKKPNKKKASSKKPTTSTIDVSSEESSGIAYKEKEESWDDESTSSYRWTIQTKSAFFRDTDAAKNAVTVSKAVKYYKNPNTLELGSYHLSMRWCEAYGTDMASREREFREIVQTKYFNTYLLDATLSYASYLQKEAKIIAENGGTIWLHFGNFHSSQETLDAYTQRVRTVITKLTQDGYRDIVNGVVWDEPLWNNQSNKDFLAQSQVHYKTFGLRNNPVFATGEFSGVEGNDVGVPASLMGKVVTSACKYITDVGYDSYGVDVRDGAANGSFAAVETELGVTINNGKEYYTKYMEYLKKHIGHDVNYWWFPTAYTCGTRTGTATEDYCIAHLKFMTDELLKDKNPGGIIIYTYYRAPEKTDFGLAKYCDLKDEDGNYKHYPSYEKWDRYCQLLRSTTKKFSSINNKSKLVNLGL